MYTSMQFLFFFYFKLVIDAIFVGYFFRLFVEQNRSKNKIDFSFKSFSPILRPVPSCLEPVAFHNLKIVEAWSRPCSILQRAEYGKSPEKAKAKIGKSGEPGPGLLSWSQNSHRTQMHSHHDPHSGDGPPQAGGPQSNSGLGTARYIVKS